MFEKISSDNTTVLPTPTPVSPVSPVTPVVPTPVVPTPVVPTPISNGPQNIWFLIALASLILNGIFISLFLIGICLLKKGKIILNCLPVNVNNANLNINALGGSTTITNEAYNPFDNDLDVADDEIA